MFFFAKKGADSVFDHLAAGKWNPCGQWKQVYGFVLITTAVGLFCGHKCKLEIMWCILASCCPC